MFAEGFVINNMLLDVLNRALRQDLSKKRKRSVYDNDTERALNAANSKLRKCVYVSEFESMSCLQLRRKCEDFNIDTSRFIEKHEFKEALQGKIKDTCPICIETFVRGEPLCVTRCGHMYHSTCFDKHIIYSVERNQGVFPTCAICRTSLNEKSHDV